MRNARPRVHGPSIPVLVPVLLAAMGLAGHALGSEGKVPPERATRVIQEIDTFNAGLRDEDRKAKYCAMASSPLTFYRGTNHLFWRDLAGDGRFDLFGSDRTRIWIQGDAHADNIGVYDNDRRVLVYDLNDFDEVVIADYQWDLWRMATSLVLIAEDRAALSRPQVDAALDAFARGYLMTMEARRGNEGQRDATRTMASAYGRLARVLRRVDRGDARARMLDQWTVVAGGQRVFDRENADLGPAPPAVAAEIRAQMAAYVARTRGGLRRIPGYFEIKDIAARRNAGTGSLGTPRYYVLIEGESGGLDDDRILDLKRQGTPAAYPYLGAAERALLDMAARNPAERTITGYRALVARADDHLGWMELSDGFYSVRERSPYKRSLPLDKLHTAAELHGVAEQWGMILASAHARADRDFRKDIIGYSLDKQVVRLTRGQHPAFLDLVRDVAGAYARQVRDDHAAFAAHVGALGICL